jgi:hypothetical protein
METTIIKGVCFFFILSPNFIQKKIKTANKNYNLALHISESPVVPHTYRLHSEFNKTPVTCHQLITFHTEA